MRAPARICSAKPKYGDDYAFRLLGLFWTDAKADQIDAAARELAAQQSLVNSSVYRRGVAYLMRTGETDGSWHVRTRAFGFQPYFESGFPHGHDQWISVAATNWAVMALAPAVEQAARASR